MQFWLGLRLTILDRSNEITYCSNYQNIVTKKIPGPGYVASLFSVHLKGEKKKK